MEKFESAITTPVNHSVSVIDNREVDISYAFDELNLLDTEVTIDISAVDWSNIQLDSTCELEVICICEKQREIVPLGTMDTSDPNFSSERKFSFLRQSDTTPFFLLNISKPTDKTYVAISHRISGQQQISDEEGLFNWEPFESEYAWDVGFIQDKGPTIYINYDKLRRSSDWLVNKKLLWQSLLIPTCLRQCITLYFQHRDDSGGLNDPWVEKYEIFIKEMGFSPDETLFTNEPDMEPDQIDMAQEIVSRYCEFEGTISSIKNIMSQEVRS